MLTKIENIHYHKWKMSKKRNVICRIAEFCRFKWTSSRHGQRRSCVALKGHHLAIRKATKCTVKVIAWFCFSFFCQLQDEPHMRIARKVVGGCWYSLRCGQIQFAHRYLIIGRKLSLHPPCQSAAFRIVFTVCYMRVLIFTKAIDKCREL